jgi:hypothetical protein
VTVTRAQLPLFLSQLSRTETLNWHSKSLKWGMGGGLSKKGAGTAKSAKLPPPAPPRPAALPVFTSQAHGSFVDDDGWQVAPYGMVSKDLDGERERSRQRAPFDTPNGGAGVGSLLRQRHLDDHLACTDAELSELPPTSLCFEVLEVGGLNEFDTPVSTPYMDIALHVMLYDVCVIYIPMYACMWACLCICVIYRIM